VEFSSVKKIYVGNLPWSVGDTELRELFAPFGTVHSASVVNDRETGRSRGFGFVEMDEGDAMKAIGDLDGREHGGRALRVNEAQERQRRGGGGGGGGGRDRW
jgi:RNA recognition motif-containing protein